MRLGSLSEFRSESLEILLHNLCRRLLEEPKIDKAFHIIEETIFENGIKKTHLKIYDIPIQKTFYTPPKLDRLPFHDNSYTFKERVKILFKGRL